MGIRSVESVNRKLKEMAIQVRVRQRGSALYLRASLPSKPGGVKRSGNVQSEIALGRSVSQDGLKYAEGMALRLGSEIALGKFKWEEWGYGAKEEEDERIGAKLESFKEYYLATNDISIDTWDNHWWQVLKHLPAEKKLSERVILDVLLNDRYKPNSWSRKRAAEKLQRFADWAKLEINLGPYKGSYGLNATQMRELPSDEEIVEWREKITHEGWQWFYGMMAAYGLRPYEPWFCEFEEGSDLLFVTVGKKTAKKTTEPRFVKPLYPGWVKRWNLTEIKRPNVNVKVPRLYSHRACVAFRRWGVPVPPKTLRHCYAVRAAIVFRLSSDTAAAFMGHDPIVHARIYKRWLTKGQKLWEYERVINDPNLPPEP